MWILIRQALPTNPSPPPLSILWATPWPNDTHAQQDFKLWAEEGETEEHFHAQDLHYDNWGKLPNWKGAVRISYLGEDIRVFPHEFKVLPNAEMRQYVYGDYGEAPTHELIPNSEADAALLRAALETDLMGLYDAALLDGCTPEMAVDVARGIDVLDTESDFPPYGWYRMTPVTAAMLGLNLT